MEIFPRAENKKREEMMSEYELLANKRIVFCYGELMPLYASSISQVIDSLVALDTVNHDPIKMVIESPGGAIISGFALYDTMKSIKSPVYTVGRNCFSMAAVILAAGNPGNRYLYPHSKVMIHLPFGSMVGDVNDVKIQTAEMNKMKDILVDMLLECGAKKTRKQIIRDMDRDFWMTAQEAINYGLADQIIDNHDMLY